MSDTPETDALVEDIGMGCEMVDALFSRKLERERDQWKEESLEQARLLGISGSREARLMARVQELERENAALRDAINALHDYVQGNRHDDKDISEILNGAMKLQNSDKLKEI